jgi:hypothetical protein
LRVVTQNTPANSVTAAKKMKTICVKAIVVTR